MRKEVTDLGPTITEVSVWQRGLLPPESITFIFIFLELITFSLIGKVVADWSA